MSDCMLDDSFVKFMQALRQPVKNMGEYFALTNRAVGIIAPKLRIAKIVAALDVKENPIRPADRHEHDIVFASGAEPDPTGKEFTFKTGDDGTGAFYLYPEKNYTWDEDEQAVNAIIIHELYNIASRVMMGELLSKFATMDMQTKISNTAGFLQFAGMLIAKNEIGNYTAFYLNVRNCKYINDIFSYAEGNEIIKKYAQSLAGFCSENEIVARLGGDNFTALILKEKEEEFLKLLQGIIIVHQAEFKIHQFTFSAVAGVARLEMPMHPGEIMRRISIAYFEARNKNEQTVFFSKEIDARATQRTKVVGSVHYAIKNRQFFLMYQPKVEIGSKRICGEEALVRWKKGDNVVPPADFIPALEEDGTIVMLDFYVLEELCRFLKRCMLNGYPLTKISFNLSRHHLQNYHLVDDVVRIIDKYEIPHEYIEIELTESDNFQNYGVISRIMDGFTAKHISTSIDDFGTGYSSLNMLKNTSLDVLKIDKSFIPKDIEYDQNDKEFIMMKQIIKLAKSLGMKIVAEGVETERQYNYLKEFDCDIIQGFLFDKPLMESEFIKRLQTGNY